MMKSPVYLINKRFSSLRKSEKRVAEYVQQHLDEVILLSLQGLAQKCGTSDATVLRFCRTLGYRGFADFKMSIVPELLRKGDAAYMDTDLNSKSNDIDNIFRQNFQQQVDLTLANKDSDALSSVAQNIFKANKILIIGLGGSAGVAHIFCDALGSLGIFSTCFQDRSIIQNIVSTLGKQDVIIGLSHSGETDEIVSAIKTANTYGANTISITNYSPSPLADIAKYSLVTGVPSNLFGSYSCQARISQLMIMELILFELSEMLKPGS